ncbi:unnamed protein product [Rotaria sp. Silwood1]|nr:unnamed protein product [Rotaria sp. Silwood1]CAF1371782.1 unnamed protein product [Rotaria sp. Silwood1]CAF3516300.1 unnamed protein product [Rotaria sp. Silwood1]CAF4823189.1 unnamed protein product [Rotaria sp. Silwood1]
MKGIILAGGLGTRLYPLTKVISKHLLPIYDKPMIYYPLSILMMADIKQILIITTSTDYDQYRRLLENGTQLGCDFQYAIQDQPDGIAQAFVIGEKFIGNDNVALILGDNFFYGMDLSCHLKTLNNVDGAYIFAYEVSDPHRYGIIELDHNDKPISIEEKPKNPKSNYAITGLYFFDNDVINIAKNLQPSHRGEYEITDINNIYFQRNKLHVIKLDKIVVWFDMGTFQSLNDASQFVRSLEIENGRKIGCIEEVAYKKNYIDKYQLKRLSEPLINSGYGIYLQHIINRT